MSASQDRSQKFKFVFHKFKKDAQDNPAQFSAGLVRGAVVTVQSLANGTTSNAPPPEVRSYQPVEFIRPRALREDTPAREIVPPAYSAIESLKANLERLTELQRKLGFLLEEVKAITPETTSDTSED